MTWQKPQNPPRPRLVTDKEWKDVDPEYDRQRRLENLLGGPHRRVVGADLAYTENAGDYASFIPIEAHPDGRYYIKDLVRCRRDIANLRTVIRTLEFRFAGATICSYISGQEKAVLALLAEDHVMPNGAVLPGVFVQGMIARFPKHVRAQRTAELWNEGKIVVPPNKAWTHEFVTRMKSFTGAPGGDDADTDALVSGIDMLEQTKPQEGSTGAFKRTRV